MSILNTLRKGGHITQMQGGKDFVLFPGLLLVAHENGIESIITEMIAHDPKAGAAAFRSVATGSRGTFSGHGDASPANLSRNLVPSYFRMAETRAMARSLRFYLGIGMTAANELPSQEEPPKRKPRIDPSDSLYPDTDYPTWPSEEPPPNEDPPPEQEPEPESKFDGEGFDKFGYNWKGFNKKGHHVSFMKDQAGFCAAVAEFGGYAAVADWAESKGYKRPSSWTTKKRTVFLDRLKSGAIEVIPF